MLEGFVASSERLAEIVRRLGHEREADIFFRRAGVARRRVVALRVLAANTALRQSETPSRDGLTANATTSVSTPRTWLARLPDLMSRLDGYALLTPREREVLLLLVQGFSNREIAERLVITSGTVANHVSRVLDKLGCRSRVQLLGAVFGMIESGEPDGDGDPALT